MDWRGVAVGAAGVLLTAAFGAAAASTAGITQGVLSALAALPVALGVPVAAWLWRHHDAQVELQREQEKLLGEFAPPRADEPVAEGKPGLQVARYLRPENQVVGFRAGPELRDLLRWCTAPGLVRVALVTGDGGAGKTRLALQLGQKLNEREWEALWARKDREGDAAALMRNLERPCLLVVDYAETRGKLRGLLAAVAGDWDGPQVRVVLLARSRGEWWDRLLLDRSDERVTGLLEAPAHVNVRPVTTKGEAEQLFNQAVTAFATERHVFPPPDTRWPGTDPAPTMLVVHATALLAVLEHKPNGQEADSSRTPPDEQEQSSGEKVLDGVLKHELWYWAATAKSAELRLDDPTDLRRALAAGCLIGADNERAATNLMKRIPGLVANKRQARRVARWLHQLYPQAGEDRGPQSRASPAAKEWIGPLRPDPVAEYLVVDVLAADQEELIPSLLTSLDEHRAAKALTVLARAALTPLTRPKAEDLLRAALARDLENLAVPAASVAVETNHRLGELLADAFEDPLRSQRISVGALEQFADKAPSPSVALAGAAAIALRRLADHACTDRERAGRLEGLSGRLAELDQPEEALAAIKEAVGIYQSLGDEFRGQLATALNSQSMRLAALGQHQDALKVIEQSVDIYRPLADEHPDQFAGFLQTLSHRLSELGERTKALKVIDQAVATYRKLAENHRDYEPKLANALNSQAMRLADLKRHEEALRVIDQVVVVYERLAGESPDAYRRTLADVRHTRSHRLADLGLRAEALKVIDEAVATYKELAEDHPNAFGPRLAEVLQHRSDRLADLGRRTEALEMIDEAVATYKELAEDHRKAFRPRLAEALHTRSWRLAGLGRRTEALDVIGQAAGIYRELAGSSPDFKPKLANTLNSQSTRLAELARHEQALAAIEEAVSIYRALAQDRPGAFLPEVAKSLNIQSMRLADLRRHPEALAAIGEATGIYQTLEADDPGAFQPDLAGVRLTQSDRLTELERRTEALEVIGQAVVIYRDLATDRPGAFRPRLADALHTQSWRLAELHPPQSEKALAAIKEAAGIYRQLEDKDPGAFEPQLAKALNSQSIRLADQRRRQEALKVIDKAVGICQRLVEDHPDHLDAYRPDLADVLHTRSCRLVELDRHEEAREVIDEAVGIYQDLADKFPGVFELELAGARDRQAKFRR